MENEVQESSPSDFLVKGVAQYCEELESLHNSFRQMMALLHLIGEQREKEVDEFIEKHGRDIKEDGESKAFQIDLDKRASWQKLHREVQSVRSAKRLIPRNFIVAIVCAYDSFLGRLIRFILQVKPEILDDSERTLKFSELFSLSNISAAREFLIEKEIETVLRKSHVEQFKWLELKLGTAFNKGLQSWPCFVELTERRNLFVHCDGIVSTQYLSVCAEQKCDISPSIKIGDKLEVPQEYFETAYRCLYEIGVKLAHVVWRKILKNELDKIDKNLIEVTFALIERGEYKIAIRIMEFFIQSQIKHSDEPSRRVLVINLAQAYKWDGNEAKCKEVISTMDWAASEDRYKIAVAALKDDFEAAYRLMKKLVHEESFLRIYYQEWPLFRKLRKQPDFLKVYEECYKEPFKIEEKVSAEDRKDDAKDKGDSKP